MAYTAAGPASFTDDLSAVLDDASYNGDAAASAGPAPTYAAPALSWSGPLAVGQTITITYSVTENNPDAGDQHLDNALVTPDGSGGNCPAGSTDPACAVHIPTRSFSVTKVASESTASPGDTVTYTITVTNTGASDYTATAPASFTDTLTGVLDDASYNNDAAASAGPAPTYAAPALSWSGPLAVGQTITITYSVAVASPDGGNHRLVNTLSNPPGIGGSCQPGSTDPGCSSVVLVRSFTVTKTATPASTDPGGTVTYTVTVHNTGQVDYAAGSPAGFTDDLTQVLDDATYNGDAAASAGPAPSYAAPVLSWSGPLPVGATVTVTYTVTVNTPDAGNHQLTNTADPAGPGGGCTDGTPGPCDPTVVAVRDFTVAKTASTAGPVHPGDTVTYTITVRSTGTAAYTAADPATVSDNLTNVLDDAAYGNDAKAATGTLSYAAPTLSWSGPLAAAGGAGDTVTITYTVKVSTPDAGDHQLRNAVVGGSNCPASSPDPACAPTPIPVASYTVTKAASATTANPGDTVTYTITVANTGAVAYTATNPASITDNLAAVLDDASYNGDAAAASAGPAPSYAAPVLSWAGPLPVAGDVTITYTVTVANPDSGDHTLTNAAVPTPGTGGGCADGSPAPCPPTQVLVQSYHLQKTADKTTVTPSEKVTYATTLTNTGQVPYTAADPVTWSDDLSSVLDDAGYNNDAAASTGPAPNYAAPTLSWTGPLAVGQTVTVSYSVTVHSPDTGDKHLNNTIIDTTPGGNCPAGSTDPACTSLVPGHALHVVKTSSAKTAAPGQKVSYTITLSNTGQADYTTTAPATFTDDLSGVLDDATYNKDATAGRPSRARPCPGPGRSRWASRWR